MVVYNEAVSGPGWTMESQIEQNTQTGWKQKKPAVFVGLA